MDRNDPHRYDDMLDLPHPVSQRHPHMSMHDRAAQFAPFAALSGYQDSIDETGRYTDAFDVPDAFRAAQLNEALVQLHGRIGERPQVQITYYAPDDSRNGGQWHTVESAVLAVDPMTQTLTLEDGTQIPFDRLRECYIV